MIELVRATSDNPDFIALVAQLDADLVRRDGDLNQFYTQFNAITAIRHVVVAYDNAVPVACGAIKQLEPGTFEIKRMYTSPDSRGRGVASRVLAELERWAAEMSSTRCVLETGLGQPEAIRLYEKNGYVRIPNYDQYVGVENSVCFAKTIPASSVTF